jgi:hypothetical protein
VQGESGQLMGRKREGAVGDANSCCMDSKVGVICGWLSFHFDSLRIDLIVKESPERSGV